MSSIISHEFIKELRQQFKLDWKGIHGASHWSRVRLNGLKIAKKNCARTDVIELFAFLHDSRRLNDYADPFHGKRASQYARELRGKFFEIDDNGFELLQTACEFHSDSIPESDITIHTCWDADRLDLGRVGIKPLSERLFTEIAKEPLFLESAYARSIRTYSFAQP